MFRTTNVFSSRLVILVAFSAGLVLAASLPAGRPLAGELDEPLIAGDIEESVAGLYDTLTKGLRARRPSEFQFITKVVVYVSMDKLTKKMVLETFHWARRKVGLLRGKYPYPYFEAAMKRRAAAVGVKL